MRVKYCGNCGTPDTHHLSDGECFGFHMPEPTTFGGKALRYAGLAIQSALVLTGRVFYRYPEA